MKTIWKYALKIDTYTTTLQIPAGAELLHVAAQNDVPCLWFLLDPNMPLRDRHFNVCGTGWEKIPEYISKTDYAGTVLIGPYVWHIFEAHS